MLKEMPFANALAVVSGGLFVVCRLLAIVAPDLLRNLGQAWFHSYDFSILPVASLGFGDFVFGLITVVAAGWLFGYFLAWVYNKLAK